MIHIQITDSNLAMLTVPIYGMTSQGVRTMISASKEIVESIAGFINITSENYERGKGNIEIEDGNENFKFYAFEVTELVMADDRDEIIQGLRMKLGEAMSKLRRLEMDNEDDVM